MNTPSFYLLTVAPEIPAAPVRHFPCSKYMTVRNGTGQYTFLGTSRELLEQHREDIKADIQRRERRLSALNSYLNGESVSCPSALRF